MTTEVVKQIADGVPWQYHNGNGWFDSDCAGKNASAQRLFANGWGIRIKPPEQTLGQRAYEKWLEFQPAPPNKDRHWPTWEELGAYCDDRDLQKEWEQIAEAATAYEKHNSEAK